MTYLIIIFLILTIGGVILRRRKAQQVDYLMSYQFPVRVKEALKDKYPHLTDDHVSMVMDALRDYFYICHQSKKRMVAMPSQVVDIAWHEFILFTKSYEIYCHKALGRFLHHTPTTAMKTPTVAQEGIKRAWRLCCAKEKINPVKPEDLPLLFAIDGLLNIEEGFKYSLNCQDRSSSSYADSYCVAHIGCTSGCVSDCGGDSGSSSDCGGGCGGD